MITTLVSGIFGLVSGFLPDMVKEIRESREATREREFLKLQHQLQMQALDRQAEMKMHEHDAEIAVGEAKAFADAVTTAMNISGEPTGYAVVDIANAILRPLVTLLLVAILVMVALGFSNAIDQVAFSALMIEAAQAVLGFVFGYRSARKPAVNA